jgi:hypothetical protein
MGGARVLTWSAAARTLHAAASQLLPGYAGSLRRLMDMGATPAPAIAGPRTAPFGVPGTYEWVGTAGGGHAAALAAAAAGPVTAASGWAVAGPVAEAVAHWGAGGVSSPRNVMAGTALQASKTVGDGSAPSSQVHGWFWSGWEPCGDWGAHAVSQ